MRRIPSGGQPLQKPSPWPNLIVFPNELREAIPEYGSRALVFDSVTEAGMSEPVAVAGMNDASLFDLGPRAHFHLLVHETGKHTASSICLPTWTQRPRER